MIVTAWNNGKHHSSGAGYGLKITVEDRNSFFNKSWKSVFVMLPSGVEVEANVEKESFWGDSCRELINQNFGKWFLDRSLAPWPKNNPPQFRLTANSENRFTLSEI